MKHIYLIFLLIVSSGCLTEANKNVSLSVNNTTKVFLNNPITENSFQAKILKDTDSLMDKDYQTFKLFKYYVYPRKYDVEAKEMTRSNISRNITIDEINLSNAFQPMFDVSTNKINTKKQLRILNDEEQFRSHYYPVDGHNFDTSAGGMLHLVDPLFLMATLAFVAFLINSILGLVDRLNLPPVVRARHGSSDGNGNFLLRIADPRRKMDNVELLDEIETALKIAFDAFESRFKI